jgi:hypothetical protein
MKKFEAFCDLLDLKTKDEKLKFLSEAMASLTAPKEEIDGEPKKRGRKKKVGAKRGRKRKTGATSRSTEAGSDESEE